MKTRHYKTLSGLFRALSYPCFTLEEFLRGRAFMKQGHCNFTLSDELRAKVLDMFASAIWERGHKKKAWKLEWAKPCGILGRVMINKSQNGVYYAKYCAGQSYPDEIRFIQLMMNR